MLALFKAPLDQIGNSKLYYNNCTEEVKDIDPEVNQIIDSLKSVYGAKNLISVTPFKDKSMNWKVRFVIWKNKKLISYIPLYSYI